MRIHVVDHPLVAHKLTTLRDERTDSPTFRRLADELVTLLAYEATRDVRTEQVDIETPVTATTGVRLSHPAPLVVPILRAGLGMLDGMVRLLPTAEVGLPRHDPRRGDAPGVHVRDPYAGGPLRPSGVRARPDARHRRHARRGDPGADQARRRRRDRHRLLAAPEGVELMERELAGTPVTVVTASVDERLNEHGYIVPGLGDAGDRMYGTAG